MIDITYYQKIQNCFGETDNKGSQRYEIKQALDGDFNNTLDAYTITINGNEQDLTIIKTTNLNIKKIKSRPNEIFYIGDVVEWNNAHWLIAEVDNDNSLVTYGKMEQCNWLLKWQNSVGDIIERWAIVASASKYNDGENGNKVIVLGSDQLSVAITVDDESLNIKRKTKFFIDNNMLDPTVYELTGTNNVAETYNNHGVTSWIVKECAYTATDEDLLHGVCNYISPITPPTPEENTWNMTLSWTGSDIIRIGGSKKTLTAQLVDENGENIADCNYLWNVESDYLEFINTEINGNVMKIWASNDIEEDTSVKVTVASKFTGQAFEQVFPVEMGV